MEIIKPSLAAGPRDKRIRCESSETNMIKNVCAIVLCVFCAEAFAFCKNLSKDDFLREVASFTPEMVEEAAKGSGFSGSMDRSRSYNLLSGKGIGNLQKYFYVECLKPADFKNNGYAPDVKGTVDMGAFPPRARGVLSFSLTKIKKRLMG